MYVVKRLFIFKLFFDVKFKIYIGMKGSFIIFIKINVDLLILFL